MKKIVRFCTTALVVALLMVTGCQSDREADSTPSPSSTSTFTGTLELAAQETTLEEASSIVGVTPTYLPEGYEIQEVYASDSRVMLLISDEGIEKKLVTHTDAAGTRQRYEFQCKMRMSISWSSQGVPGGLKLPGERPEIKPSGGITIASVIVDRGGHNDLWWHWRPDPANDGMFEIVISAAKNIPKGELVKVAESVQ